jgi:small ligand-binding sensory domain FIST
MSMRLCVDLKVLLGAFMKFASILSDAQGNDWAKVSDLLQRGCEKIMQQLDGQAPNLLLAFVSPHFVDDFDKVPDILFKNTNAKNLLGCSASGLIGGGCEVEMEPAIALTAAVMPDVKIDLFHLVNADLPDSDASPQRWCEMIGVSAETNPHFLLLPDPFSFRIDSLIEGLDYAFPGATKIGGMASGARKPGVNALYINEKLYRNGTVGAALHGDVVVETIVAQGCRPIGKPLRVTRSQKNYIFEIDEKPAVHALHDLIQNLTPLEQELAQQSLFIGIAMDEFRDVHKPGDFLIRNILAIDPTTGALIISELVRAEQTIQFHVRDAATSADDLRFLLKKYRDTHDDQVYGALLFSCLGRGQHLYGMPNHDSDCFREYLGGVPLGGFFCNGEIGPVGGTTFLHGYTSSFGIFRSKELQR